MGRNHGNTRVYVQNSRGTAIIARDTLRQAWHDARRIAYRTDGRVGAFTDEQPPIRDPRLEFFVSAVRGARRVIVSGPYDRHQDALDAVSDVRRRHTAGVPTTVAWEWSWGTCSRPRGTTPDEWIAERAAR